MANATATAAPTAQDFYRNVRQLAANVALEWAADLGDREGLSSDMWEQITKALAPTTAKMPTLYGRDRWVKSTTRAYVKTRLRDEGYGFFPQTHDNGFSLKVGSHWIVMREVVDVRKLDPKRAERIGVLYRNRAGNSKMASERIKSASDHDFRIAKACERIAKRVVDS
jgi:hypothetical protein